MNKNAIIAILAIAVIGIGAFMFMNRTTPTSETTNITVNEGEGTGTGPNDSQPMAKETTSEATTMMEKGEIKEFTVKGSPFEYDVKEMVVNEGDTVRITFENDEGMHDWVIDEFNARTQVIAASETETIEFVADQTGTFEYYCSVGTHRAQGMVGNLIVE